MIEIPSVDIFTCPKNITEAMTVTTNGIIKSNGDAVMGRGIALTVDNRYHVAGKLAEHLRTNGNTPCDLGIYDGFHLLSYPTKNDWRDDSSLELIADSSRRLMVLADELGLTKIYSVKPGCSNGHLDWQTQVKPVIQPILDDRFVFLV